MATRVPVHQHDEGSPLDRMVGARPGQSRPQRFGQRDRDHPDARAQPIVRAGEAPRARDLVGGERIERMRRPVFAHGYSYRGAGPYSNPKRWPTGMRLHTPAPAETVKRPRRAWLSSESSKSLGG